ncbi:MAG TPA: sigma 54-interacting transcriptional regulator [Saprospiraceae bacterium]|nr:sigma 54-interacting transcriptional regulator [Saprospiraceae bacterium]
MRSNAQTSDYIPEKIKCLSLCQSGEVDLAGLTDALKEQGVAIQCSSIVLIFFDRNSPEETLHHHIREYRLDNCRVLLVDLSEERLPFYKTWQLLSEGVEEVLNCRNRCDLASSIAPYCLRWGIIEEIVCSEKIRQTMIGNSHAWRNTLREVVETAVFSNASLLIQGETGTGKELVARLVHDLDPRPAKQDLILLDCSTLTPDLAGSEFFGHEKGAFTSAISTREGAFALADGGTLFLDEIGELPLPLQAELLRVTQEGAYKRIGSNQWRRTEFRLICATHHDLRQEVQQGRFRADLYYRIATCTCRMPPLRERREDICDLAAFFLRQALPKGELPEICSHLRGFLLTHPFPGNVRELRQLMLRLALRYPGAGPLGLGALGREDRPEPSPEAWHANGFRNAIRLALANGVGLKDIKRLAGETAMELAVEEAGGNLPAAAKGLGVTDRAVQLYWAERDLH